MAWGRQNPLLGFWDRLYHNMTPAESALEPAIAALGERYRSQHPFWGLKHFADFALLDRKLIIEVDGDSHDTPKQKEKDLVHTIALKSLGWAVVRISNETSLVNPQHAVKAALIAEATSRQTTVASLQEALDRLRRDHPELLLLPAKRPRRVKSPEATASAKAGRKSARRTSPRLPAGKAEARQGRS